MEQSNMAAPFRRIVTGHNAAGRAIIQSNAPPTRNQKLGDDGPMFYEVWNTRETPARIDRAGGEPVEDQLTLAPPRNGTRIRVLDIPPETERMRSLDAAAARAHFAALGAADASTHSAAASPHPFMHRTETIDYGIVLEGEVTLLVDEGETIVRQGDIVVQRGTNHAWANRSGKNCRIAFILIDGQFVEGLE
jgi:mannose-6-phosphate isomerase-like protein (cupin superfamily)